MIEIRLKYLIEDVDRHGNVRLYVRRPGQPKRRIRAQPGTAEFVAQYQAALSVDADPPQRRARAAAPGSFRHLCIAYFSCSGFAQLDISTRSWQRRALERICEVHAEKPIAMMQPRHVRILRDEMKEMPAAANTRLKALRALFRWAIEADQAPHDPTLGVRPIRYVSRGHHAWTADEVAQFEHVHPPGSKARLPLALMLYTSWRREDAVRLGPQHIRDGRIRYRQAKNEHRNPVDMDIPLHPDLGAAIAATKIGHLTFLITAYGRPYSAAGFGNAFKHWCREAGLPHCSAHGLRKAAATRLAERGATPHEIMAITGHRTLDEVERYTRSVRKRLLADAAISKLRSPEK